MVTKTKIVQFTPNQIRDVRLALGMTQAEFAEYLDVGTVTVPRWENGHFRPNKYAVEKLKAAAIEAGFDA